MQIVYLLQARQAYKMQDYVIPVILSVLSHGELGILYASDQPYKPDRLWSHFSADKCRTLAGKPKMFFIQVD